MDPLQKEILKRIIISLGAISLLLSGLVEKKYLDGNVGTYKIGEFPWHNDLGFYMPIP
jgi:hypothetical protein